MLFSGFPITTDKALVVMLSVTHRWEEFRHQLPNFLTCFEALNPCHENVEHGKARIEVN